MLRLFRFRRWATGNEQFRPKPRLSPAKLASSPQQGRNHGEGGPIPRRASASAQGQFRQRCTLPENTPRSITAATQQETLQHIGCYRRLDKKTAYLYQHKRPPKTSSPSWNTEIKKRIALFSKRRTILTSKLKV